MSVDNIETLQNELENVDASVTYLVKQYGEYACETVMNRAFPAIDGFKPAERRILYTMYKGKVTEMSKCADVVGMTLRLHPHGDATIYDTLARMTDKAKYCGNNIAFITGKGNFGHVFNDDKKSADRYTECKLSKYAEELFSDMQGAKMIGSYDNKYTEPELLPVTFPYILCNPTVGIAVGLASNIPSFNFNDVVSATIEFIETGKISKYLYPDFTTGGTYVRNDAEAKKFMTTGCGQIKLRGKWYIEGKTIHITEIPYYTTAPAIINAARAIQGVTGANDDSDINGFSISVEVNNRHNVDFVVGELLRTTDLQMTLKTNMSYVGVDGPHTTGIIDIIKSWVDFRRLVLTRKFNLQIKDYAVAIKRYTYLTELVTNAEYYSGYFNALHESDIAAISYLKNIFPDIPSDVIDWIVDMRGRQLANAKNKVAKLDSLKAGKAGVEYELAHLDETIIKQLQSLNSKYVTPRLTEVSDHDIIVEEVKEVHEAYPVGITISGKFIKKSQVYGMGKDEFECMSDDVISFIDNKGRLLRVFVDDLPVAGVNDVGTYLAAYLGIDDDFEIMAYDIVKDGLVKAYLYKDGVVGVIDYSEWANLSKHVKVTKSGVSPLSAFICAEIDLSAPYVGICTDSMEFTIVSTVFKHKKRTATTRLVTIPDCGDIISAFPVSLAELMKFKDDGVWNHFVPLDNLTFESKKLFNELSKKYC